MPHRLPPNTTKRSLTRRLSQKFVRSTTNTKPMNAISDNAENQKARFLCGCSRSTRRYLMLNMSGITIRAYRPKIHNAIP